MSCSTTSAMRRSLKDFAALSTAAFAAFSHDSVLVPTNSMTLYTDSGMASSSYLRLHWVKAFPRLGDYDALTGPAEPASGCPHAEVRNGLGMLFARPPATIERHSHHQW